MKFGQIAAGHPSKIKFSPPRISASASKLHQQPYTPKTVEMPLGRLYGGLHGAGSVDTDERVPVSIPRLNV